MSAVKGLRPVLAAMSIFALSLNACGRKPKDKGDDSDPSAVDTMTGTESGGGSGSGGGGGGGPVIAGAPVPGTAIAFSEVTHTGFKVSWGEAKDPVGLTLSYKVVYASAKTDIDTVEKADAVTGNAASEWLPAATTSANLSGLTLGTTYAVAVLVKNAADLKALYAPATQMTLPLRVFVTQTKVPPLFSAAVNADNVCNGDARKPSGGETYKALISATWRIGCNGGNCSAHNDWPLKANTTYAQLDGTVVAKTNANGLFIFPLTNLIEPYNSSYPAIWSGMDTNWNVATSENCTNWTNSTSGTAFIYDERSTSQTSWSGLAKNNCTSTAALLCIEQ